MATKKKKSEAFDVKFSAEELKDLANDLATELSDAITARQAITGDGGMIDLVDWYYEQGRTAEQSRPFPGAADLTSWTITESIDSMRARIMQAIGSAKPFCYVEGWGKDASKAPMVESFSDWQARKTGLLAELGKVIHGGLIEDCYILEVSEKIETRRVTQVMDAAFEGDLPVFDEKGKPILARDPESGELIEATPDKPAAKAEVTQTKTKRLGPEYTPISMKDFVFLPGHAQNVKQLRGYAKRIWLRVPQLQEMAKDGIYDQAAVDALGEDSDREASPSSAIQDVQSQTGAMAEKEAWQVNLLADYDKDGREEPYVITLSLIKREILRVKLDKFVMKVGMPRCVPFVLYPRRNSNYGYSFGWDKMLTLAEEHTSLRNMKADRSALVTNAPILRQTGSLWNPDSQPFGVGRVIDVNQASELQLMQMTDVPQSVTEQEAMLFNAKERVSGLADISTIGTNARQSNTLGQDQMVSRASAVRVDEVVQNVHRAIAQVMALSHAIWVETLEADPKGLDAPTGVAQALAARQMALPDNKFTAEMLKGEFQFEPSGSTETADRQFQLANFNNSLIALTNLAQVFPTFQALFAQPQVAKAVLEQWLRVYDVKDRQAFLGAFDQMGQMPMGMTPGPGAPMGAEPPGAPQGGLPPEIMGLLQSMGQQGATGDGFGFGGGGGY